jgi:PAS domain-containing protein
LNYGRLIAHKQNPRAMNPTPMIDYETIFLQAPVGMCISENRVIQNCNDALAAMFGYTRQ